jgi:hypothetical protein
MFGMKKESSQDSKDNYLFDLEVQLKEPGQMRAMKEQVETRVNQLKTLLRAGGEKQVFDQAQTLLHAYLAMQKVFDRVNRKGL